MFLRELVLGGLQSGALCGAGGVWRWEGAINAPPRLVELIESRLGQLEPEERDLWLVAFGEPLGAVFEEMVAGHVLAATERQRLLTVGRAGRRVVVRLAHPLFGETVRGGGFSHSERAGFTDAWRTRCN